MRTAVALALAFGFLGVALRLAIPVAPVDNAFRDVVVQYRAAERARDGSNRPETPMP